MRSPNRICAVLSAGGSAFEAAFRLSGLSPDSVFTITDRACGAEERAQALGIAGQRLPRLDREALSASIARIASENGCRTVLLHFDRLVTESLHERLLTFNVHPSLLPAFPGPSGVEMAARAKSLYQGATLHIVDAGVDSGPIISQTVHPVPMGADLAWRNGLSFVQKTAMTLSFFDLHLAGRIDHGRRGHDAVDLRGIDGGDVVRPGFADARFEARIRAMLDDLATRLGANR